MKRLLLATVFFAVLSTRAAAQDDGITYQQFYNDLSPYGDWIDFPPYGYVWQPYFERPDNFTPYSSGGRWVYTDYGWTWASDYEWGWAPFHYGRWFYDDYMGWLWIPGYEWAPAWVTWGSDGGNYGWAPLGPGISISVGMSWRPPRNNWWTFVPCTQFGGPDWNRYIIRNHTTIVNHVTIINNIYDNRPPGGGRAHPWMRGPRPEDVQRFSRRPVQPLAINTIQRPQGTRIQNNSISIYRPAVRRAPQGANFRPVKAQPIASARPESRLPMHSQDRRDNNPGNNRPIDRPGRPAAPPGDRPGNPGGPGNRPGNPPSNNPRPDMPNPQRPVNPGTRPENRPTPPQNQDKPPVNPPPGNRPEPRPDRPMPERPANRPPSNPGQPGNRPANPGQDAPRPNNPRPNNPGPGNNPGNPGNPRPNNPGNNNPRPNNPGQHNAPPPNPSPGLPPTNRPAMPPQNRPAQPPQNRPAMPPQQHHEQQHNPPPGNPPHKND